MKLHLGSGEVKLSGWLNVDLDASNADLHIDLTKRLPFDDESINYIFNEHFIEHISRESATDFLRECFRVLVNNGVVRISTPNLKYISVSYLSRNMDEWDNLWRPSTPCQLMNEAMRFWGHKFLYDAEELVHVLTESGFSNIKFVRWRESDIDEFNGIENRNYHNELIIEATKNRQVDSSQKPVYNLDESEPWLNDISKILLSQVKRLEQTVDTQNSHIKWLEADQTSREQHIAGLELNIKNKDTHISNLETDRASREQHIAGLELNIKNKDTHISNLETDRASREQHIAGLELNIKNKDTHISNLETDRASREQHIAGLELNINNQTTHISNIEAELSKFRSSCYGRIRSICGFR